MSSTEMQSKSRANSPTAVAKRVGGEVSLVAAYSVTESATFAGADVLTDVVFGGVVPFLGAVQGVNNIKKGLELLTLAREVKRQETALQENEKNNGEVEEIKGTVGSESDDRRKAKSRSIQQQGFLKAQQGVWQFLGLLPGMWLISIPFIVACEVSAVAIENSSTRPSSTETKVS
jgi:hypothetical protein